MSMINLYISDNKLHFNIDLNRRVNFIMGESATGKTSFYDLLVRKLAENDEEVLLKCNIQVRLLDFSTVSNFSEQNKNLLYIVDDLDILSNSDFLKQYKLMVERNFWFLIMSREEVADNFKTLLTFSTDCLFKLDNNGNKYFLSPLYNIPESSKRNNIKYDCVIIEDEKGGYEFFGKLYSNVCKVFSSKGKNNITRVTLRKVSEGYKNILVIFDNASFGSCFEEFYKNILYCDAEVEIISSYECFEELLASTNLLRYLKDIDFGLSNLESEACKFSSWERYFEYIVQKATVNKPYKYTHKSSLRHCYLDSCNGCNNHIKEKCDYLRKEDEKIIGLLKDTKYEFLLNDYIVK